MTSPPPQMPLASAPVTIVDVFAKQIEMGAQLAVITEQLKAIPDHEMRIRSLEAARGKLIGAAVVVSAVISGFGYWIGYAVTRR